MFKEVSNELELAMFNGVWTTVWREKGYELEFANEALARYIVMTKEGNCVGSSEIKAYDALSSPINRIAPFYQHPKVREAAGAVAEIDKMALLRTYRSKGVIAALLSSAVYCAEMRRLKYFVSLLEPVFLRALKITFKVPLESMGDKLFYKGDYVVPVLFHMEEMYRSKQRYEWLAYPSILLTEEQVEVQ